MDARVLIDATSLPAQLTGAGRYLVELIKALDKLPGRESYVVVTTESARDHFHGMHARTQVAVVPDMSVPRRLVWEQFSLPRYVRKFGCNVLHCPHYTMPIIRGSPVVVTFHDMIFILRPEKHERVKRLLFPWYIRYSARFARRVIASSGNTRRDIVRLLGIPETKIAVAPLAVSPTFRVPSDHLKREVLTKYKLSEQRYLLYVGVLEPRKGLDVLASALERLRDESAEKYRSLELVIVGRRGWLSNNEFTRLQQTAGIRLVGWVADEDLPALYAGAAAFVYLSEYEGFGLPPLEAMSCGAVVVTSNSSSLPEVVGGGGIQLPVGDVDSLVKTLQRVLSDADYSANLRKAAVLQASRYSWERTAQLTRDAYVNTLR